MLKWQLSHDIHHALYKSTTTSSCQNHWRMQIKLGKRLLLWSFSYNNGYLIYEGKLMRLWSPLSNNELIGDIHLHISAFDEMGSRSKTKNSRKVAWIIGVLLFLRLIFIVLGVFWRRHSIGVQVDSSLIMFKYKGLHKATKNLLHKKYCYYNLLQQNICCERLPQ